MNNTELYLHVINTSEILTFLSEGRPVVHLDETWLSAHHTCENCWIDYDGKGGLRVPFGKGGRLIILHAGWEQGWIADTELVCREKTGTGDYHQEMNTNTSWSCLRRSSSPTVLLALSSSLTMPNTTTVWYKESLQRAAQRRQLWNI